MGQIVIEIPDRKSRRFVLADKKLADVLIVTLERSAVPVKRNPATIEELEEAADIADIKKAVTELRKTGKIHKWDDVKVELGI